MSKDSSKLLQIMIFWHNFVILQPKCREAAGCILFYGARWLRFRFGSFKLMLIWWLFMRVRGVWQWAGGEGTIVFALADASHDNFTFQDNFKWIQNYKASSLLVCPVVSMMSVFLQCIHTWIYNPKQNNVGQPSYLCCLSSPNFWLRYNFQVHKSHHFILNCHDKSMKPELEWP